MRRALLAALLLTACGEKRKPIARGDAGPSVLLLDGRAADLALPSGLAEREPNDTLLQAQPLVGRIGGSVSATDVDVYRVDALPAENDAGTVSSVATVAVEAGEQPILVELIGRDGKAVLRRRTAPHAVARITGLRLDAPSHVRVRRDPKATTDAAYTIEATTRGADAHEEREPNDDVAHAERLESPSAVSGTLDSDDRDVFELVTPNPLDEGTWRVELTAVPGAVLEAKLMRADGVPVVTVRGGKGEELRLRNLPVLPSGGFLQVRASDKASTGSYLLRVASESRLQDVEVEPNDDRAHATSLDIDMVVDHYGLVVASGYLWPGDVDWFCLPRAIGASVDGVADVDIKLELTDDAGKTISTADAGKRGAREELAQDPRARCVRVSAHGRESLFDGPYRLSISSGVTK